MSNVLRSTTFQLEFNGNDGITGVRTFTKAVRDADAVTEELTKSLGENATVTYKNVESKQELVRQARAITTEMTRNETRTAKLTEHYKYLATTVGKTADEMEVLNAVQQLGSKATDAQKKQVADSVMQYQQLKGSVNGAQGSMRNFRGVVQNAGWQLQDTVVQLQMGTSAFTVLSQQGSQMASAFGPTGAVVGAVIALAGAAGGILFKSLLSATEQTKKLDAANKALSEYITINAEGVTELSTKYEELARISKIVADTQLAMSRNDAMTAQAESVKLVQEQFKALDRDLKTIDKYGKSKDGVFGLIGKLDVKKVELMRESFKRLSADVTPANIENFLTYLNDIDTTGKKGTARLNELRKMLVGQFTSMTHNQQILDETKDGWDNLGKTQRDNAKEVVKAFEAEAKALTKQTESVEDEYQRRKQVILDYIDSGEDSEYDAAQSFAKLLEWRTQELEKQRAKAIANNPLIQAFEKESKALSKQTESIGEEYARRKQTIDDFVAHQGSVDAQSKKAYADLEAWKTQELDKEYQKFSTSLTRGTRTTQDEYNYRKNIIDGHVKLVGFIDEQAAKDYVSLEAWKTEQLKTEYDKRELIRAQIENAQISAKATNDPLGAENDKYTSNMLALNEQLRTLGEDRLDEKARINNLIEAEQERHTTAMNLAELQVVQNQVALAAMASTQMTNLANIMSTGTDDIKAQVAEMNDFQKAMFLASQAVAATQALVDGISLGMSLAAMFPLAAPAMLAAGTGLGAATSGAIMGATIAGAFDNGGYIPSGQIGAVAGFGDEFVNGTLIEGPANVTSRKDTAELLRDGAGGGNGVGLNISIQNEIKGANYDVQQLSETDVRIIARQEFDKNIDKGVSNTLSNSNSKSAKAMRQNYDVRRNL